MLRHQHETRDYPAPWVGDLFELARFGETCSKQVSIGGGTRASGDCHIPLPTPFAFSKSAGASNISDFVMVSGGGSLPLPFKAFPFPFASLVAAADSENFSAAVSAPVGSPAAFDVTSGA